MLKSKKKEKITQLKTIKDIFSKLQTLLIVGYSRLAVEDFQNLKNSIASEKSQLRFFKNSLLKKATQEKKWDKTHPAFNGKIFLIYNQEESIETVKKTFQFNKQFAEVKIKLGFLGENWLEEEMIKEVALLPTKQELLRKLATILKLIPQSLILILKKVLEKKEKI